MECQARKHGEENQEEFKCINGEITNIPHTFTLVPFLRYDPSISRLLRCNFCNDLLWQFSGPTELIKAGFYSYSCTVCRFMVHPNCRKKVTRDCIAPTEVFVWDHAETGDESFLQLDLNSHVALTKGFVHFGEQAVCLDRHGKGFEIHFLNTLNPRAEPLPFPLCDHQIKMISSGASFTLFLTSSGQIFGRGKNAEGQLGIGPTGVKEIHDPVLMEAFKERVVKLQSGGNHSLAITESNRLFGWGDGRNGRLGTGNTDSQFFPVEVKIPFDSIPSTDTNDTSEKHFLLANIACGWSHSLVVVDQSNGKDQIIETSYLFSFGRGEFGQCGHGERKDELSPRMISAFPRERIIDVSGGYYHSTVCTFGGSVYCFGFGEEGQCGSGSHQMRLVPYHVTLPEPMVRVSCGGFHTVAVAASGKLYKWGGGTPGMGVGDQLELLNPSEWEAFRHSIVVSIRGNMFRTVIITYDEKQTSRLVASRDAKLENEMDRKELERATKRRGTAILTISASSHQLIRCMHTQKLHDHYEANNKILEMETSKELEGLPVIFSKMQKLNMGRIRNSELKKSIDEQRLKMSQEMEDLQRYRETIGGGTLKAAESLLLQRRELLEEERIKLEENCQRLSLVQRLHHERRKELCCALREIFPISHTPKGEMTIGGFVYPTIPALNQEVDEASFVRETKELFPRYDKESIAVALGQICLFMSMLSRYLEIPLAYRLLPMGSRSMVAEGVRNYPFQLYPLYAPNAKLVEFRHGIYYLHKDIQLFLSSLGLRPIHGGNALESLEILISFLCDEEFIPTPPFRTNALSLSHSATNTRVPSPPESPLEAYESAMSL